MSRLLVFSTTVFVSIFSHIASAEGMIEAILGYQPSKQGISFQVKSGGCTARKDFEVRLEARNGVMGVTLVRITPDNCYPLLPMGERLKFAYAEIGLTPGERFTVNNPNGVVYGFVW